MGLGLAVAERSTLRGGGGLVGVEEDANGDATPEVGDADPDGDADSDGYADADGSAPAAGYGSTDSGGTELGGA